MLLEKSYDEIKNIDTNKKNEVLKRDKYSKFIKYLKTIDNELNSLYDHNKDNVLAENAKYIYQDRYYITYSNNEKDESPEDVWKRVARSVVSVDTYYTHNVELLRFEEDLFYKLLKYLIFLPNSPTLFNIGKGISKDLFKISSEEMSYDDYVYIRDHQMSKNTLSACYFLDFADSLESIMNTLKDVALISGAGGGIGLNFSKLRPEFAKIRTGGYSSGSLSFLKTFNELGENILEGGIRRFAGMAILGSANLDDKDFWRQNITLHPDILDFIALKHNNDGTSTLRNFNISVGLNNTKEFLNALDNNKEIPLEYNHKTFKDMLPDDFDKIYDKLPEDKKKTVDIKLKGSINAKKIFKSLVSNAWKSGDPGFVFLDKANKYNPLSHVIPIRGTNPCGEQVLRSDESYHIISACNLASIDVSKFVINKKFSFKDLFNVSQLVAHFLDLIIDLNMYPVNDIKKGVLSMRDTGLGFMGLHGSMILQNIEYDTEDGANFAQYVMKTMEVGATYMSYLLGNFKYPYLASKLANNSPRAGIWEEKSSMYNNNNYSDETVESVYRELLELQIEGKLNKSIRNISSTTSAPTGTISQLIQSSKHGDTGSGVEPLFALKYDRYMLNKDGKSKTKIPYFTKLLDVIIEDKEELSKVKKYIEKNNTILGIEKSIKNLSFNPNIFKTALEIDYMDHLKMLEATQYACSSSVSKTINMKKSATEKDVENAFRYAMGSPYIKGITIYRDGSLQIQVLNTNKKEQKNKHIFSLPLDSKGRILPKRKPVIMESLKQEVVITNGHKMSFRIELGLDTKNEPFEVFIRPSSNCKEYATLFNAIGRLMSFAFRSNLSVEEELKQLKKVKDWNNNYDPICNIIADTINELLLVAKNKGKRRLHNIEEINEEKQNWKLVTDGYYIDEEGKLRCPVCGSELVKQEGCITCNSCGWSACM